MPHGFRDTVHAVDIGFAELAAIRIDRQPAAAGVFACPHEILRFAALAKTEGFELRKYERREMVVDGRGLDVVGAETAHRIELIGDELSAPVGNFVRVLADNKRLPLLAEIAAQFEQLKAQQEKSVNVEVASAFPLPDALADKLAQALRGKLQREVSINTVVDQSLLGGVVVRAGDVVIDGSVRGRLAKLARAMNS